MDYVSLIAEFGEHYGLGKLEPDESGIVGFAVDGRPTILRQMPEGGDSVIAMIEICRVPEAGAAAVNRLVLKANLSLLALDGMAIVLHPENECYRLLMRFDITALDFASFDGKIGRFLKCADQWSAFLERFIPIAAEVEATGGEDVQDESPDLSAPASLLRV